MRFRYLVPLVLAAAVAVAGLLACKGEPGKTTPPDKQTVEKEVAKPAAKGPSIACDEPNHDVGMVVQGDTMKHVFVVKNVGDDVLNVLSARGG